MKKRCCINSVQMSDTGKNYFRFKLAAEFEGKLCEEFLEIRSFLLELYV